MRPGILSAGIENGGHWPWPSRSFWPCWRRILGNSACQCDNSSQIWARITKFAPNMRPGILSAGIDLYLQDHFGHFDLEFLEIWLVCVMTCNGFELESPNLHQICILGFSHLLLKMEVIDLDLQGHLAIIPIQETAFNIDLVYWSRPAKGCYTSQTCSCYTTLKF